MLYFYSDLANVPVQMKDGSPCGRLHSMISSYATGHMVGIVIKTSAQGTIFINKDQLLSCSKQGWILRTCEAAEQPTGSGFLVGKRVYTNNFARFVGRVTDIEMDGESWYLLSIEVRKPWWKFSRGGYIIPRKAITEITEKAINVDHIERYAGLPKEASASLVEQLVANSEYISR